jgi:hypothetical protein
VTVGADHVTLLDLNLEGYPAQLSPSLDVPDLDGTGPMVEVESRRMSVVATVSASSGELVFVHPLVLEGRGDPRCRYGPSQDERVTMTPPAAVMGVAVPTSDSPLGAVGD